MTASMTADSDSSLYRQIVENTSFGLLLTDLDGNILYANPRQCEASGYAVDELIGRNTRLFRSEKTPIELYRQLWATIAAGGIWHGEMINRRKNGDLVNEYVRISPVRDGEGGIVGYLAIKEEHFARDANSELAGRLSTMDALTGLPNRDSLLSQLGEIISNSHASRRGFALLLIDIDRFHRLNEKLGQIGADHILLEIVSRLAEGIRADDLAARVGGDEFALVLRSINAETLCAEMASRVVNALAKPFHVDGQDCQLTVSIGIARYPTDGRNAESLLRTAYVALEDSKRAGGGQYCFYVRKNGSGTNGGNDLTNELRDVVLSNQLRLHFQPQLSLLSGEIVGVEALVRWQHPERGLIPPNAFIPIAEESGVIIAIGEWVLAEACRQMELTESAMMHDAAKAVRTVDRLKQLGVRISLDDFGTGYSSLAYLSRFAIDRLKVDQSFIRDITSNPVNASITTATIAMAHKLAKVVIAEGVETEAQMHFLRRHDCDEMQGFLFSKALPADELEIVLRKGHRLNFDLATANSDQPALLLVDDEPSILNALRRLFRRAGYRVLTANGGAEALELLAVNPVQIIISDQRMPEMSGVEFLSRVKDLYPQTVRMVLSGYSELSAVTDAINRGAIWKYINKPWDDDALLQEVRNAFHMIRSP